MITVLSVLLGVGLFPMSCRRVMDTLLNGPVDALRAVIERREASAKVAEQQRLAMRERFDGLREDEARSLVPGALVGCAAFLLFIVLDAEAAILTFVPMLQLPMPDLWFAEYLALALGLAVVIPAVFAHWVSVECSQPNLLRLATWTESMRARAIRLCHVIVSLCVVELLALGLFRADAVTSTAASASTLSTVTQYMVSVLLVISLALAAKLAWLVGPAALLGLAALRAALPPVVRGGAVLRWAERAASAIGQLGLAVYGIVEAAAQLAVRPLVVLMTYVSRRARGEVTEQSWIAALMLAASDWIDARESRDGSDGAEESLSARSGSSHSKRAAPLRLLHRQGGREA
ncbi:MAG: hypothetical protein IPJ56_02640 [Gemmatimonadetes bacterium]|nr:hypothetical protein [Gemmatimonadota bacterium]